MINTLLTVAAIVGMLIGFTALYVGAEFAAVSARRPRLTRMAAGGSRLAKSLLPILQDAHKLDNYIAASQVGITLTSILLGIYGQRQIAPLLAPLIARLPLIGSSETAAALGTAAFIVLIILTTLQVVLGELLPKSIAIQYPEQIALATALPMRWSAYFFFKPLIWLLNGSGVLILKLLGIEHTGEHAHVHSPEEIVILVKDSYRGGLLDSEERQLLRNLFRVRDVRAREIAVPRTRMVAAPADKAVEQVLRLAADSAYSRIPIYEDDIDHIAGFVHLHDLFTLYHVKPDAGLSSIIRPIPFVPETLPAIGVWERMNQTDSYLAVVLDEFGGTLGLVTREDMIEELFGEVQDEFDQERALITAQGDGRLVVRGDMAISYLNDLLDINLPHDLSYSLGGLVQEELGRIPKVGDEAEAGGVRLRVEGVTEMRVTAVSVVLPPGVEMPPPEDIEE